MRKCVHCGRDIPEAVLIKGRWKATFCSQECRLADRNAIRDAKSDFRKARGLCPTCGRKRLNAREQTQAPAIPDLPVEGL